LSVQAIFSYSVEEILNILPEIEGAFLETWRYHTGFPERIEIRRQPGTTQRDVLHQLACVATRHHMHPQLTDAIDALCDFVGGRTGRATLLRIQPNEAVAMRLETGHYADAIERFWLPIVAEPQALAVVADNRYHPLEVGTMYAIDVRSEYGAGNHGKTAAVILQADVFPETGELRAG
jgi:hypothetical protein